MLIVISTFWLYGSVFYIMTKFGKIKFYDIITSVTAVIIAEINTFIFIYIHIDAVDSKIESEIELKNMSNYREMFNSLSEGILVLQQDSVFFAN